MGLALSGLCYKEGTCCSGFNKPIAFISGELNAQRTIAEWEFRYTTLLIARLTRTSAIGCWIRAHHIGHQARDTLLPPVSSQLTHLSLDSRGSNIPARGGGQPGVRGRLWPRLHTQLCPRRANMKKHSGGGTCHQLCLHQEAESW